MRGPTLAEGFLQKGLTRLCREAILCYRWKSGGSAPRRGLDLAPRPVGTFGKKVVDTVGRFCYTVFMLGHNGEGIHAMAHFFIATQTLENYGAHNGSGRYRDGATYWKMKGGTDYIITGVDRVQDAVAFVAAISMENGIGYKEFPTHWEEVDPTFQTDFERSQMEYDGEIAYPAQRIHVGEYMAERAKRG